jgi:hypothetical protein
LIVYLTGEGAALRPLHTVMICPAADLRLSDCPSDWLEEDGRTRKTFGVDFCYGRAEVPTNVGEYLVAKGYAAKTRLIVSGRAS